MFRTVGGQVEFSGSPQRVGFLDRSQALLVPPQRSQPLGEVVQAGGEVG
jgi:hypothetical protein